MKKLLLIGSILMIMASCITQQDSTEPSKEQAKETIIKIDTVLSHTIDTVLSLKLDTVYTTDTVQVDNFKEIIIKDTIHSIDTILFKTEIHSTDTVISHSIDTIIVNDTIIKSDINSFTDPRDGEIYTTAVIGTQIWMTKNVNFFTNQSKCFEKSTSYCNDTGRLYNWLEAKTVACPEGWKLPSLDEWGVLARYITDTFHYKGHDGSFNSPIITWDRVGASLHKLRNNDFRFNGMFSGYKENGVYSQYTSLAGYWTSTHYSRTKAHAYYLRYSHEDLEGALPNHDMMISVRCIKDI